MQCAGFRMSDFWQEYEDNISIAPLPHNCGVCEHFKKDKCEIIEEVINEESINHGIFWTGRELFGGKSIKQRIRYIRVGQTC